MSATSTRLRWALGIAVAVHLLLGLWFFADAHRGDLARAARRLALAEQALLPTTVQVAPLEPRPAAPKLKAAEQAAAAAQAAAEVQRLQLAAAQAAALAAPAVVEPLQARPASGELPPATVATQLATPGLARAAPVPVVQALQALNQTAAPAAATLPKLPAGRRTPLARAPAPVPPPTKLAAAKPAAPTAVAAKPARRPVVEKTTVAAASPSPRRSKPAQAAPAPLMPYAPPKPAAVAAPFFTEREETYQLPTGKLSVRLANPPPRPALAAASGKGLAVESEELAAAPAPLPAAPPPPPEPLAVQEAPARAASELPRLNTVAAPVPKPPAPSIAALSDVPVEQAAGSAPAFPPVTIYQAPEPAATADAESPPVPRTEARSPRAAFFQDVTTQLKATNAQVLADALRVGQKITVRMKFSIRRDGALLRIAAAVKTPDWAVAEAARIIRAAAPFPPMPADLSGKSVELAFPVDIYAP